MEPLATVDFFDHPQIEYCKYQFGNSIETAFWEKNKKVICVSRHRAIGFPVSTKKTALCLLILIYLQMCEVFRKSTPMYTQISLVIYLKLDMWYMEKCRLNRHVRLKQGKSVSWHRNKLKRLALMEYKQ